MGGINTGPGEGKGPKDRNEFPLGPFHIDVDIEVPQVRQKAEKVKDVAVVLPDLSGSQILSALNASYNSITRIGEATLTGSGQTITYYNATRLPPPTSAEILVTQLEDGRWMMLGLVSDIVIDNAPIIGTPSFTFDFPMVTWSPLYDPLVYEIQQIPCYDLYNSLELSDDSDDTVIGGDGTQLNGFSRGDSTQFNFGIPPGKDVSSSDTKTGITNKVIVVKNNTTNVSVYDPLVGSWANVISAIGGSDMIGSRIHNTFLWANSTLLNNWEYYDGTSIVSLGTLGMPSGAKINRFPYPGGRTGLAAAYEEQNNGYAMITYGSDHYVKDTRDLLNFTLIPYSGTIPAGVDLIDYNGHYLYTITPTGNIHQTGLLVATQTLIASGAFPATFTPRTAQLHTDGYRFIIAGEEDSAYLPTASGKTGKSLAVYIVDVLYGTSTLLYYDHDVASTAGITYFRMGAIETVDTNAYRLFVGSYGEIAKLYQLIIP